MKEQLKVEQGTFRPSDTQKQQMKAWTLTSRQKKAKINVLKSLWSAFGTELESTKDSMKIWRPRFPFPAVAQGVHENTRLWKSVRREVTTSAADRWFRLRFSVTINKPPAERDGTKCCVSLCVQLQCSFLQGSLPTSSSARRPLITRTGRSVSSRFWTGSVVVFALSHLYMQKKIKKNSPSALKKKKLNPRHESSSQQNLRRVNTTKETATRFRQ